MRTIASTDNTWFEGRFKALESRLRSLMGSSGRKKSHNGDAGPVLTMDSIPAPMRISPFRKRIRAAELVNCQGLSPTSWLPFLGHDGFLAPGLVTLLSGYAKAGKTTLVAHVVGRLFQQGKQVLWVTEESERIWRERVGILEALGDVELAFPGIRSRGGVIQGLVFDPGRWDVVIVDTIRTCLEIPDENDAQAIVRNVQPIIELARERGWALLLLHHLRKSGGDEGLAHAGSNALVALVDIAVELHRSDPASPNRRKLKTVSRLDTPEELLLELGQEGMVVLGDPEELSLQQVMERIVPLLTIVDGKTVEEIEASLGNPKPSSRQVRKALDSLVDSRRAARDGAGVRGDPYIYRPLNV